MKSLIGGLVIAITKLDKMSGVARFLSSFFEFRYVGRFYETDTEFYRG